MSNEHTFTGYLGPDFQLKLLWQLITEGEFAEKTLPLLEINYFDDPTYKRFFSILTQYNQKYNRPANLQNRSILLAIRKFNKKTDTAEIEMLDAVAVQIKNWNDRVLNKNLPHDGDVIQKETLNFIKQQEYRKVSNYIQNGVKNGNNSDEFLFNVEEQIKKISEIGSDDDMGVEIMENVDTALEPEFRKPIPTGIKGIDTVTNGGLGKGEIGIILAPSGVGKSTILSYIANTAYNMGYNVLQIIFEDKYNDIKRKHFAKWTNIPLSEMTDRRDEVRDKIFDWHKNNLFGRLVIKKFSQEDTTMPKVRQYIKNYSKKKGVKFDIVILDYIDVLEPHKKSTDQNAAELSIIKSFEGMADELDIPAWTAIQTNRGGFGAELVDTTQMGGNIKRAQKTHFLMSVAKTQDQKLIGQANIQILKARMAQDGHVFKDCIFNNDTMEISITDEILPRQTRMMLDNLVNDKSIEDFNAKIHADNENQASEDYNNKPPEDNDISIQPMNNANDISNMLQNGESINQDHIDEITSRLNELNG